ncbi:zf-HC2 domain-containing protein [Microbacterium sp. BWT-B31]|uniref:zf-HC2 domain-containing protein n=1 Tax=Microbacterium sp. BWT-B31 TaxID=3232072 RepID=UPI0035272A1E
MTDCGCDKALRNLEEFLRDEVCKTEYADIAEHLANCPGCADEAHVARTLTDAVARACQEKAPDELRTLVIEKLRAAGVATG